jgi:hypothetical protein
VPVIMLSDEFLPRYQEVFRHEIKIAAPVERVYPHVRDFDMRGSSIIQALFVIRGIPGLLSPRARRKAHLGLTLEALLKGGFILLGERPPREMLLGAVGRFWAPTGDLQPLTPEEFTGFDKSGYVKAVWSFLLTEGESGGTHLVTETRLQCLDETARRRFRPYWWLIRPFSGLVRQEILRAIKRAAEAPD